MEDRINELEYYIRQLEDENLRLKLSIKSLRTNNKGLMQGLDKLRNHIMKLKKMQQEANRM